MKKTEFTKQLENSNTNYESKIIIWHDGEITACILSNIEIYSNFLKITNNENESIISIDSITDVSVENN
jgi:hypothetical protein